MRRTHNGRLAPSRKQGIIQGYKLTPAVLDVCQDLLNEAWPILYQENILKVGFGLGMLPKPTITRNPICCDQVSVCETCAISVTMDDELLVWYNHDNDNLFDENLLKIVMEFQKFKLMIESDSSDDSVDTLRAMLYKLSPAFANGNITVHILTPFVSSSNDFHKFLHIFRIIRCVSFEFRNSQQLSEHDQYVSQDIKREITSTLPVLDVFELYRATQETKLIYLHLARKKPQTIKTRIEYQDSKLMRLAANLWHPEGFFHFRESFFSCFEKDLEGIRDDATELDEWAKEQRGVRNSLGFW